MQVLVTVLVTRPTPLRGTLTRCHGTPAEADHVFEQNFAPQIRHLAAWRQNGYLLILGVCGFGRGACVKSPTRICWLVWNAHDDGGGFRMTLTGSKSRPAPSRTRSWPLSKFGGSGRCPRRELRGLRNCACLDLASP